MDILPVQVLQLKGVHFASKFTWYVPFQVIRTPHQLRRMDISRLTASGVVPPALVESIMTECDLETLTRMRCGEGTAHIWEDSIVSRLLVSLLGSDGVSYGRLGSTLGF